MSELKKYKRLRRKVVHAQQEVAKAEGQLEQLMSRLKAEFGCLTLRGARRKLLAMDEKEARLEKELKEAMDLFERKWSKHL